MTMVNIAGSYDQQAEPRGDFSPVPDGEYIAQIVESNVEPISRHGDKGECLRLTWKIDEGEYAGRLIWQRLNMYARNFISKKGKSNDEATAEAIANANTEFASIRHATGVATPQDSNELHFIPCLLRVEVKVDPQGVYPPNNEVKSVAALGGQPTAFAGAMNAAPQAPVQSPRQPAAAAAPQQGRSVPWGNRAAAR